MSRTNIEIDDELLAMVTRRYRYHTQEEAVHAALREVAARPAPPNEPSLTRGPIDPEVERRMSWDEDALLHRPPAGLVEPISFSRRMGGLFLKMGAVAVLIFGVPMFHVLWTPLAVIAALGLMIAGSTLSPSRREQGSAD
jgi:hypothetical protein